ncbi:MAG: homocysteine S-methyltransferase family protein, partial [Acetobacteraceae bacterium]
MARQCVTASQEKHGTEAFVAGAVGSLGVRLEPFGRVSPAAARAAFAEQIAALAEGGVDLLILETMMSLDEAEQGIAAAREAAPHLPVIVLMTADEEANCLDGSTPEQAARRLTAAGVDAIGCNCSMGPATVLSVIERMRPETMLPLVAMPNAGIPRNVEGRNIYMSSPEYLARFARKAIRAGASWVGGCCGTTPAHIRAMRSEIRAMQAQDEGETSAAGVVVAETPSEVEVEPAPLASRSEIGRRIAKGEFVHLVEIVPPKGFDCSRELAGAALLAGRGVHAINVPDSPRASARMSAQSLCVQIQQKVGIETVLHYTCRDRNLLSIQSDLLGASSLGLRNILCLTGDPPKLGNYPDATAVFDVDAIGLVNVVNRLNHGLDIGGNPIG